VFFESAETLVLAILFLVPGFVIKSTECWFIAQRSLVPSRDWLGLLSLSLLNNTICFPLIRILDQTRLIESNTWLFLGLTVILFIPILLGLLFARFHTIQAWPDIFKRIGLSPTHPTPNAWDWKFSQAWKAPMWLIITLKNEDTVAGLFASNSFVSSDIKERDIYIEQLYTIQNGIWKRALENKGILIVKDEIRHIEFMEAEDEQG